MPRSNVLRRNGRVQACEPCRLAKHRCDHTTPICNRCQMRGKSDSCVYHPAPMTKVRETGMRAIGQVQRILPETKSPQSFDILSPVMSVPPSTYGSPSTSLFKRPGRLHDKTSFSAVFNENQAQIGADLLHIEDDGSEKRKMSEDPVRMNLATQTLAEFPTYRTCERLLETFSSLHDLYLSPKMIRHCLKSVWDIFGNHLKGSVPEQELPSIAETLFRNGESAPCPDTDEPWVNWFCGSTLRWEMIGVLFTFFGFSMMYLDEWDPIFNLPEQRGRPRKSTTQRMRESAFACLSLRNTDHAINDVVVILIKNISKLHSQIAGDECGDVKMYEGMLLAPFVEAGLHHLPENVEVGPHSEFRRQLSASVYYLEKSGSLFESKPPAMPRFYYTYQIPLDLTEEDLYSGPQRLATAISQLDKDGWNTCGRIDTITWMRALIMITPIREEILEIALGINMHTTPGRVNELIHTLETTTSSYPSWVQYRNINQWSQPSFSSTNSKNFFLVTRIQLEVLQTKFLLDRLNQSSSNQRRSQALFETARDLMEVTLSLWLDRDRDRLHDWQSTFHWMAVDYGTPAAGVLCVELLYNTRYPNASDKVELSKSDIIQSLVQFVSFLDWVRPNDGNHELCRKLKKVIRKILDQVLAGPAPAPPKEIRTPASDYESIVADQFDPSWTGMDESDWMDLLNTMDWTQGFGVEASQ